MEAGKGVGRGLTGVAGARGVAGDCYGGVHLRRPAGSRAGNGRACSGTAGVAAGEAGLPALPKVLGGDVSDCGTCALQLYSRPRGLKVDEPSELLSWEAARVGMGGRLGAPALSEVQRWVVEAR